MSGTLIIILVFISVVVFIWIGFNVFTDFDSEKKQKELANIELTKTMSNLNDAYQQNQQLGENITTLSKAFQLKCTEVFSLKKEVSELKNNCTRLQNNAARFEAERLVLNEPKSLLLNAEKVYLDSCFLMDLTIEVYTKLKCYDSSFVILNSIFEEVKRLLCGNNFQKAQLAESALQFINLGLEEGIFLTEKDPSLSSYADDLLVESILKSTVKTAVLTSDRELLYRIASINDKNMLVSISEV